MSNDIHSPEHVVWEVRKKGKIDGFDVTNEVEMKKK